MFIVGHTDNVGGVDYNMKLSQARADACQGPNDKVQGKLTEPESLWGGAAAPVAPNKTEDGRAKNRRVELVEQ